MITSFRSPEGQELVRQLAIAELPSYYIPYHYQIEGLCATLDGLDLVAIIATRGGKTAYTFLVHLVINAIHADISLPISKEVRDRLPRHPVSLLLLPTNNLEVEKVCALLTSFGLDALAINSDTLLAGRESGRDLWQLARSIEVIILSPEQLTSDSFKQLLDDSAFRVRLYLLHVDKFHLIYKWGPSFRKAFYQIGYMHSRLPDQCVCVATTATLLKERKQEVFAQLRVKEGQFHLIHHSNHRDDLQFLIRPMSTGIGGRTFPDLHSTLTNGRRTIIACNTINLGFRVLLDLYKHAGPSTNLMKKIRLFNSLNEPSYNQQTQHLFETKDPESQIIIARDTLCVGANIPGIADVIMFGVVADTTDFVQWPGRANRDHSLPSARGIHVHHTQSARTRRTGSETQTADTDASE
ncbi:uncharacterized protein STEHIDRAFT_60074 [Stereum hirsutum FP-91666 SS1]|uniref:uncharacterized protein n=1 Tax=Stereum hirsutum (strain FP-91666) TaxID=721885 RepID=UPI0004449AB4|nr:uncharacterized protein STEHIDRAFT_60074 [Stereum hirsutum FP-91666 SS1]EIM85430.1 hypothetical protein STEHIDRAFT_60074 [Stereum hirsutum FP-91666 SS1]